MDNVTEDRAIVDTHRHPIGPKLAAKMAERGFYDPKQPFPQTNAQDLIGYREFYDLEYAMPRSREEGVTLSLASNGGEVEWLARDLLKVSTGDALKILNEEYLEIRDGYPGEFALMANAHALDGAVALGLACRLPPLSSGGALVVQPWLRFHTPLIEPDVQVSRIRLSDKTSRLRPRHVVPKPAQAYEPEVPVEVREWIAPAPTPPNFVLEAQPPAQPHRRVSIERSIRLADGSYREVRVGLAPTGKRRLLTAHANSGHSRRYGQQAKST